MRQSPAYEPTADNYLEEKCPPSLSPGDGLRPPVEGNRGATAMAAIHARRRPNA
jgi:hypothetical protein